MSSQVRILFPPHCRIVKFFPSFAGQKVEEVFSKRLKAGVAQLVERQPSKLQVAGSSLVSRSMPF